METPLLKDHENPQNAPRLNGWMENVKDWYKPDPPKWTKQWWMQSIVGFIICSIIAYMLLSILYRVNSILVHTFVAETDPFRLCMYRPVYVWGLDVARQMECTNWKVNFPHCTLTTQYVGSSRVGTQMNCTQILLEPLFLA